MGSMIGSGIFIVSAEISRLVDSPALLIAAWLVTGFMTITGALAYGELAAMMPHAGGQYVYLREASARSGASSTAGRCSWSSRPAPSPPSASPSVSSSAYSSRPSRPRNWICAHCAGAADSHWAHGAGQHGCRPQHAEPGGHSGGHLPVCAEIFGVRPAPRSRTSLPSRRPRRCWAWCCLGLFVGRNAQAIAANFGANFWRNAGWDSLHPVQVGVGGPIALVGMHHHHRRGPGRLAVFLRRLEQHHLHRRRGAAIRNAICRWRWPWEPARSPCSTCWPTLSI